MNVVSNASFETGGPGATDAPPWSFSNGSGRSTFREAPDGEWYAYSGRDPNLTDSAPLFSSVWQVVDVPNDANELYLRFHYWPQTQDANVENDQHMVIVYKGDISQGYPYNLGMLVKENINASGWEERTFNLLTALREDVRGQRITVYFSTYNDGNGRRSWMYLDNVRLLACR